MSIIRKEASFEEPFGRSLFWYLFKNNNLVLVRHYDGLGGVLLSISREITSLNLMLLPSLKALLALSERGRADGLDSGLQSEYFKRSDDTHPERNPSALLDVSASILEKRDGVFFEPKGTDPVIRSREEVDYLNENFNPHPFDKEYLDTLFKYFVKSLKKQLL